MRRDVLLNITLAVALLAVLIAGPAAAGARFDPEAPGFPSLYGAFNDSYKQALYATSQGDKALSARELMATQLTWQMLLSRFYEQPPEPFAKDVRWRADLAAITGYLEIANQQLGEGEVSAAHETLEPIRRVWWQIRERNGVRWFGDELTRFHDVMEPTVLFAQAGVGESNMAEFQAKLDALCAGWQRVQEFGHSPSSAEDRQRFEDMMASETRAIENLRTAARALDYPSLAPLALAVKQSFAALYLAFG